MIWYVISLAIIVLDQITKNLIKTNVAYGEKIPVIENFLYITHHTNTGAAWGIFDGATVLLTIFSGLVIMIMALILLKFPNNLLKLSFSFILGGALGNQIDRMFLGKVTDFIDTYYWGYNFPVFNVADSFIVIGSILLLIYMFFFYNDSDFAFLERSKSKKENKNNE